MAITDSLASIGLIGVLVIVALVVGAVAGTKLLSKWRSDEERADTEDRMREASKAGNERQRVAFRDRPKRWPLTTKLFFTALVGFTILLGYAAYTYYQTGGPSGTAFLTEITAGTYGVVLISTGIWLAKKQQRKAGELTVLYEQGDSNHQETLRYERDRVRKTTYTEGKTERTALLLPLFKDRRFFGLFWARLLSADRDELRDRDHRRPEDRVLARVEIDDESVTWDQDADEITVRASDRVEVDAPRKHWDYAFEPSKRRSEAEVKQLQQDKEELEQIVQNQARRLGIYSENMRKLETMLENRDHFGSQRLQEQFRTAMEMALGMDRGQMEMSQVDPDDLADADRPNGFRSHPRNGQRTTTATSGSSDEQSSD